MKAVAAVLFLAAIASLMVIAINAGLLLALAILVLCASTSALLAWALVAIVATAADPHPGDIDEP